MLATLLRKNEEKSSGGQLRYKLLLPRRQHGRINHSAKRAMAQPPSPAVRGQRATKKNFLGYLIVIYIGNQITDIYATQYHRSTVLGLLYEYDVRHYQLQ